MDLYARAAHAARDLAHVAVMASQQRTQLVLALLVVGLLRIASALARPVYDRADSRRRHHEVTRVNHAILREGHSTYQALLELADVERPLAGHQHAYRIGGKPQR